MDSHPRRNFDIQEVLAEMKDRGHVVDGYDADFEVAVVVACAHELP